MCTIEQSDTYQGYPAISSVRTISMRFASRFAFAVKACLIITMMTQQVVVSAWNLPNGRTQSMCELNDVATEDEDDVVCDGCGCCQVSQADEYCSCCDHAAQPAATDDECCDTDHDSAAQVAGDQSAMSHGHAMQGDRQLGLPRGCTCLRNQAPIPPSESPTPRSGRDQVARQVISFATPTVVPDGSHGVHLFLLTRVAETPATFAQRTHCVWLL